MEIFEIDARRIVNIGHHLGKGDASTRAHLLDRA